MSRADPSAGMLFALRVPLNAVRKVAAARFTRGERMLTALALQLTDSAESIEFGQRIFGLLLTVLVVALIILVIKKIIKK